MTNIMLIDFSMMSIMHVVKHALPQTAPQTSGEFIFFTC